jgi:hypothetical protein
MNNSVDIGNPPPAKTFPYEKYIRKANGDLRQESPFRAASISREG